MPDDNPDIETAIVHAAYADKVKDAFNVFAENLAVGQAEKSCKDRFLRSLLLLKKARDLALDAMSEEDVAEPPAAAEAPGTGAPSSAASAVGGLSEQDRALIEQAVGGTTGVPQAARPR